MPTQPWPMGNGFTQGDISTGPVMWSALHCRRWSVSVNATAVPDRLFLARSVRYNQAAIQNCMSRPETKLETSGIKLRWANR